MIHNILVIQNFLIIFNFSIILNQLPDGIDLCFNMCKTHMVN